MTFASQPHLMVSPPPDDLVGDVHNPAAVAHEERVLDVYVAGVVLLFEHLQLVHDPDRVVIARPHPVMDNAEAAPVEATP